MWLDHWKISRAFGFVQNSIRLKRAVEPRSRTRAGLNCMQHYLGRLVVVRMMLRQVGGDLQFELMEQLVLLKELSSSSCLWQDHHRHVDQVHMVIITILIRWTWWETSNQWASYKQPRPLVRNLNLKWSFSQFQFFIDELVVTDLTNYCHFLNLHPYLRSISGWKEKLQEACIHPVWT